MIITQKDAEINKKFIDSVGSIVSKDFHDWLTTQGFFIKPAAIKHHGNYTRGLIEHSIAVMDVLVEMTEKLNIQWSRPESPYIIGMFHDICKLDDYCDENATNTVMMGTGSPTIKEAKWIQNPDRIMGGHGDKSVILLSQFINLTEEEMLCIRFHMGAYVTDGWDFYDRAIRKYETVLWTHTADMYASKVKNI